MHLSSHRTTKQILLLLDIFKPYVFYYRRKIMFWWSKIQTGDVFSTPPVNDNTLLLRTNLATMLGKVITKENKLTIIHAILDGEYLMRVFENPQNQVHHLPVMFKALNVFIQKYSSAFSGELNLAFQRTCNHYQLQIQKMAQSVIFYKYWFEGKDKPIVIEAFSRQTADHSIERLSEYLMSQGYDVRKINNLTLEKPIAGVSTKHIEGVDYVWQSNGEVSGWQPK